MSSFNDLWDAIKAELDEAGAVTRAEVAAVLARFPRQADPESPADPVHRPPATITADGSRDVSDELTGWLATVPDESVVDLGQGVYLCQTRIVVTDRVGLTIRGGTLLRTEEGRIVYPQTNAHLLLVRPVRCKVEGLTVRGTNTVTDQRGGHSAYKRDHEFDAAVRFEDFRDCAVTGLDADGIWGDGVQWQVGQGVYMADCRIDRNGRQGVTVIAKDVLIERVRVERGRRAGFDIEPDTSAQGVGNIEIRHCYTNTGLLAFASGGPGVINDVWLHDNVSHNSGVPILHIAATTGYTNEAVATRSRWTIERHTHTTEAGSPAPAIRARNVRDLTVKDCTIPIVSTQSRLALGLERCGGTVTVTGNDWGAGRHFYNREPEADLQVVVSDPLTETP